MVRSSKIEVLGMAPVGRGDNELERRGVIKMLLDAGVESSRELSERSGLCKATISILEVNESTSPDRKRYRCRW